MRLLHNRNLDWSGATRCLYGLGGAGPLSAATIGVIGRGRKALTPDLVAGFAAVLGMAAADLGVLTGVDVTGAGRRVHPGAAEAAALLWEARRLTAAQVSRVQGRAALIRLRRGGGPGLGRRW
ncbi:MULTISPECIES: hypothetical protein [Catenuloplanes]|uniref:Uncharacterized protein n=1 Tax=Catenuloplanes niger TaxID=587534 RepID=A0AAE3ZHE9_9ACTN|nr:hypothetical protein [Catenuloplanes niger]MDR7320014.1 hypothetical protein [Catenuloplanes niger]